MFSCQHCGQLVPPHTPATLLTVEVREKVYPLRPVTYPPEQKPQAKRRKARVQKRLSDKEKEKRGWLPDPGGRGYEIARQIKVCPACAAELRKQPCGEFSDSA